MTPKSTLSEQPDHCEKVKDDEIGGGERGYVEEPVGAPGSENKQLE